MNRAKSVSGYMSDYRSVDRFARGAVRDPSDVSGIKPLLQQDHAGIKSLMFEKRMQPRQSRMRNSSSVTGLPPAGQGVNQFRIVQERGLNTETVDYAGKGNFPDISSNTDAHSKSVLHNDM